MASWRVLISNGLTKIIRATAASLPQATSVELPEGRHRSGALRLLERCRPPRITGFMIRSSGNSSSSRLDRNETLKKITDEDFVDRVGPWIAGRSVYIQLETYKGKIEKRVRAGYAFRPMQFAPNTQLRT
jgi:hypothetical protein